jgi:peptidoglycan/xylan/chitin deacetylase (PgdA/CDA1 family)
MSTAIPILLYHNVSTDSAPEFRSWTVRPEAFAAHMSYLRDQRYSPITVTQLAQAMIDRTIALPAHPVVITFDDGLADFYLGALPVLADHGFSATLYVVSGLVGRSSSWLTPVGEGARAMLSWSQLAEIQSSGVECGAHSVSHPQLDIVSRTVARDEICRSRVELQQRLGRDIMTFAYPHGYYSARVRRLVQEAGYTSACGVKHAMSAMTDDRFALARIVVPGMGVAGPVDFASLLQGSGLPVAPRRRRLGTRGWRLVRRSAALLRRQSNSPTTANKPGPDGGTLPSVNGAAASRDRTSGKKP